MNCDRARALLSAQLDGELRGLRRRRLARHLTGCVACAAQLAALAAQRDQRRALLPRFAAPAQLQERVRALMENAPALTPGPSPTQRVGEGRNGADGRSALPSPALRAGEGSGVGVAASGLPSPAHRAGEGRNGADGRSALPSPALRAGEGSGVGVAISGRIPARRWQWLAGGALAGSAATICALVIGNLVLTRMAEGDLVAEAVGDHVRASMQDRIIEVASSDRHTVKPWLSARLDYSPPVVDLPQEGFALVGGRLDTLHGRKVATLVYRYRLHTIDVFVRPEPVPAPAGPAALRGFNVAHASGGGMDFLGVSDVSADVLEILVRRLATSAPPAGEPPAN